MIGVGGYESFRCQGTGNHLMHQPIDVLLVAVDEAAGQFLRTYAPGEP